MMGQLNQHFNCLIQFSLKRQFFAGNHHIIPFCLDSFFRQIESVSQGKTCPSSFNALQQSNENHILSPGIFGLIRFSGMIEDGEQPKIFLPVLGLMKSSKATNKRPSDRGSGIMLHKVRHSLSHGSLLDAINA